MTGASHDLSRLADRGLACLVVLALGLPLFYGLDRTDLANDEAIYAYAVDRILETGDWLSPESIPHTWSSGDPGSSPPSRFLEKPPLKFWITAAPIWVGIVPHNEFGLRFMDALLGAIALLYVFRIGRRVFDPIAGFAGAWLLFVHAPFLFDHGIRSTVMEASVVLAYAGGIDHFLAWRDAGDSGGGRHVYMVVAWTVFGFLTKFVAIAFLPLVIGLAAAFDDVSRRRFVQEWRRWLGAVAVAVVVVLPWFVYQFVQAGWRLFDVMLGQHVMTRFTGTLILDHVRPREFYFTELRAFLDTYRILSWVTFGSLFLVADLARRWDSRRALVMMWFWVPLAVMSFGTSKLYYYSYPFHPGLMLAGGYAVSLLVRFSLGRGTGISWLTDWRGQWQAHLTDLAARRVSRGAAARAAAGVLMAPMLILVWSFPFAEYGTVVERARLVNRPLGAVRDCVAARYADLRSASFDAATPLPRSSVYVHLADGVGLTANYYYYYRVFDVWERPETLDVERLTQRLFEVGQQAPVLTTESEIREADSVVWVEPADEGEIELPAADAANFDPGASTALAVQVGVGGTTHAIIVLPGPFSRCVDSGVRAGGTKVAIRLRDRSS